MPFYRGLTFKGIKLNLQLFAGDSPPTDPPNNPPGGNDPGDPPPEPKTFTQEEVNAIASKEAKKAQEKFLKSLGFDDFNNAKEGLSKLKEWQDSQKTDSQKQAELLKNYESDIDNYKGQVESLTAQLSATSQGVKADSLQDVVTLAKTFMNDETDINQAITKVLEKYPHFKGEGQQQEPGKPSFTTGQHQKTQPTEKDKWLEIFKPTK